MSAHFHKEMEQLKKEILTLSATVEDNLGLAIQCLDGTCGESTDRQLIEQDKSVDEMEVMIEENCLKLLALYQPVAVDLRFIAAVLKINNDLERISDLAVKVCKNARKIGPIDVPDLTGDYKRMSNCIRAQMRLALRAFIDHDARLARRVLESDDEIDDANKRIKTKITAYVRGHIDWLENGQRAMQISRRLERIADLITNIAEDVVYMTEAVIVRHHAGNHKA